MKTAILEMPAPESCAECRYKHHRPRRGYFECLLTDEYVGELKPYNQRPSFCPLIIRDENACPKCGGEMISAYGQALCGDAIFKDSQWSLKKGYYCQPCNVFVFEKED